MTNLIETAFFFDSRSSRLMQVADFTAYAVYRWYEAGDDSYLKLIHHKFDREVRRFTASNATRLNQANPIHLWSNARSHMREIAHQVKSSRYPTNQL